MRKLLLFCFSLCIQVTSAQLPETDIWLFHLKHEKGKSVLGEGKNITARKGYDNQPIFSKDDKLIYYVSIREDNQSDVYTYNISKNEIQQFTKTKVSEYSPAFVPGSRFVSCVVVEADSAQRIWLYHDNGNFIKKINEQTDSVGYYSWYSADTLLYYKLTHPHSLWLHILYTGHEVQIARNPSRAIRKLSGNRFLFAIKDSSEIQYYIYNADIKKAEGYARHKSGSEDFVFHSKWGLLKSEGAQILAYDSQKKEWTVLFDLASAGIKKITRFAFSANNKKMVIVDNP